MRDNIMTAKLSYSTLFESIGATETMGVVRILTKNNDGFKRFKGYLEERINKLDPGSARGQVIKYLLETEPAYINEKEVEDYKITTIVYPYYNFRGYNCSPSTALTCSDGDEKIRQTSLQRYFRGSSRVQFYVSENIPDISIEIANYDRGLRYNSYCLLFPCPANIPSDEAYLRDISSKIDIFDREVYGPGIKLSANPKKEYTHNSMVKITYKFFDNIIECLNSHENGDLSIALLGGGGSFYVGKFELKYRRLRVSNANKFTYKSVTSKYKAIQIGNKIVFYDGHRGLNYFKDKIAAWGDIIHTVSIMQYHGLDYPYFLDNGGHRQKVVIRFLNPKDYSFDSQGIRAGEDRRGDIYGRIWKNHKARQFTISYNFKSNNDYNAAFDGIVPFGEKAEQAVNCIDALIREQTEVRFREYFDVLLDTPVVENEEDILTTWFTSCVKAKKHNDDNLLRAYGRMRTNLMLEYKALEDYMGSYDFSKVIPVPTLILDKKTKDNLYKSLHILARNIKINNVNNKKIKEINKTRAMVDLMFFRGTNIFKGSYPLLKYYNPTKNALEFNYNKMKGELIHDKIKNRG